MRGRLRGVEAVGGLRLVLGGRLLLLLLLRLLLNYDVVLNVEFVVDVQDVDFHSSPGVPPCPQASAARVLRPPSLSQPAPLPPRPLALRGPPRGGLARNDHPLVVLLADDLARPAHPPHIDVRAPRAAAGTRHVFLSGLRLRVGHRRLLMLLLRLGLPLKLLLDYLVFQHHAPAGVAYVARF